MRFMQAPKLTTGMWNNARDPDVELDRNEYRDMFNIYGSDLPALQTVRQEFLGRLSWGAIDDNYRLRFGLSGRGSHPNWLWNELNRHELNRHEPTASISLGQCIRLLQSELRSLDTPKLRFERWLTSQLLRIGSIRWWRKWLYFLWRHLSSSKRVRKLAEGEFLRVGKHFSCCLLTRRFSDDFHVSWWSSNPDRCKWIDVEKVIVALHRKQFSLLLVSSEMDAFGVCRCAKPKLSNQRMITFSTQSKGYDYDPLDEVVRIGTESSQQSISRPSVVGRISSGIRQIQRNPERSSAIEKSKCRRKSGANVQNLSS